MRSSSCRATSASSAARSASTERSSPFRRIGIGRLYSTETGSSWARNHRRCCANDSGSGLSRSTGTIGDVAAPGVAASIVAASPAMVGVSNSAATGTSTANTARIRDTTWVASSECPPRVKKSSCTPTRSTPSSSAQIPASNSCTGPDGGTYCPPRPSCIPSTAGRAARSTLPLRFSGSPDSSTNTAGTMYSGNRAPTQRRSSSTPGTPTAGSAGTRYATNRRPASPPSATTTASATSA